MSATGVWYHLIYPPIFKPASSLTMNWKKTALYTVWWNSIHQKKISLNAENLVNY